MNTKNTQNIISEIFLEISQPPEDKNIDGLYLQKKENIEYLTEFSGSFSRIILSKKQNKGFLISDSRYSASAKKLAENSGLEYREIIGGEKGKNFWKDIEAELEISVLGFEKHNATYSQYQNFQKFFDSELKGVGEIIEKFRLQKSENEIKKLQKAAETGDKALAKVVENFEIGITEKDLAWIFEEEARKNLGAEGLSFDTIVAFAENSALPHHTPSNKKLEKNTAILIDCGVKFSGYCSDMTRCFWFGEKSGEKSEKWKKMYKKVHDAQKAGIEKMTAGTEIHEADTAARKVFETTDDNEFYLHSFGHGVGREIHENPGISSRTKKDQKFLENMIVTAEPGLYYAGEFGIRIEDLLVIKKTGKPDFLSHTPYFEL